MLKKLINFIFQLLAALAFFAGLFQLLYAASIPGSYGLFRASAVQITQVYSEATYTVLLGVGYLLVAIFIQLILSFDNSHESRQLSNLHREVFVLKRLVSHIATLLQKRQGP